MTTDPNTDLPPLSLSPEVQAHLEARTIDFIDQVFDEALDIIVTGDQQTRAGFVKTVLPILIKSTRVSSGDVKQELEDLVAEVRDMHAEVGGRLLDAAGLSTPPDPPDSPGDDGEVAA